MTLRRFSVGQCGCMDEKSQCSQKLWFRHYYQWLFLQVALSHLPPLWVLEVHINVIYSYHRVQNSYQLFEKPWFDSNVVFYYFYVSPLPTVVHIIAKGNTFSISSLFDVTKLQKIVLRSHRLAAFHSQYQWTHIFISLTIPIATRTQLGFKRHRESY